MTEHIHSKGAVPINTVLPQLVPAIAQHAGLTNAPINLFSLLGGQGVLQDLRRTDSWASPLALQAAFA